MVISLCTDLVNMVKSFYGYMVMWLYMGTRLNANMVV